MHKAEDMRKWQIDRSIPIAFLLFCLIQTGGLVLYVGRIDWRGENTSNDVKTLMNWKDKQGETGAQTESRLAVIEQQIKEQSATLLRIESNLDRTLNAAPPARVK